MAHTVDQTLLAELGFADPDKNEGRRTNPQHDMAGQYLSTQEVMLALAQRFLPPERKTKDRSGRRVVSRYTVDDGEWFPRFEQPIVKGEGQYAKYIGFLDLILPLVYNIESETFDGSGKPISKKSEFYSRSLVVEIKIAPVPTGQVLRQIKLYREFITCVPEITDPLFMLATKYPISTVELEVLANEDIKHALLAEGFDRYVSAKRHEQITPAQMFEV